MFTLPLHRVLGESLGILFVGFIRDLASAALLSLRTKVGTQSYGAHSHEKGHRQLPSLLVEFWEVPK